MYPSKLLKVSRLKNFALVGGFRLERHAIEERTPQEPCCGGRGTSKFGYAAKGGTFQAISAKLKYSPIRDSASRVMLGRMLRCPASKVMVRM